MIGKCFIAWCGPDVPPASLWEHGLLCRVFSGPEAITEVDFDPVEVPFFIEGDCPPDYLPLAEELMARQACTKTIRWIHNRCYMDAGSMVRLIPHPSWLVWPLDLRQEERDDLVEAAYRIAGVRNVYPIGDTDGEMVSYVLSTIGKGNESLLTQVMTEWLTNYFGGDGALADRIFADLRRET